MQRRFKNGSQQSSVDSSAVHGSNPEHPIYASLDKFCAVFIVRKDENKWPLFFKKEVPKITTLKVTRCLVRSPAKADVMRPVWPEVGNKKYPKYFQKLPKL